MRSAFEELVKLADGVQLTPGNHPTPGFAAQVAGAVIRTHHGFHFERRASAVWSAEGCRAPSDSVHPPMSRELGFEDFARWVDLGWSLPVLETMYPGYLLGSGEQLEWAMARRLALAVDVSHLHMQRCAGLLEARTWRRLMDYPAIAEVHVSANDGQSDQHAPLRADTFGLEWARAQLGAGTPVVLECYMHRLDEAARRRQVALLGGA